MHVPVDEQAWLAVNEQEAWVPEETEVDVHSTLLQDESLQTWSFTLSESGSETVAVIVTEVEEVAQLGDGDAEDGVFGLEFVLE